MIGSIRSIEWTSTTGLLLRSLWAHHKCLIRSLDSTQNQQRQRQRTMVVEDSREKKTKDCTSVGELNVIRDKIPLGANVFMWWNISKTCKKHYKVIQHTWPSSPLLGDQWDFTNVQKLFSSGKIKESSNS